MAPRRRCPTCGSKQWHKEPASGLIACSEGHILQNYRNETTEVQELGPHAMKKRTLKTSKGKKGKQSKANEKLYHGARGRFHYFLCLQLIFRKQVFTLIDLWDLPAEFEIICRDLWALNLALLPDPPPAEPYHFVQENKTGTKESSQSQNGDLQKGKVTGSRSGEAEVSESDPENEDVEAPKIKDEEISNAQDEDEDDQDDDDDDELDELMRENSEISSSSEDEAGSADDASEQTTGKKQGKRKGHFIYESPACTIAVLMVACWTLRLPVMSRDLTRLIELYELPYLEGALGLPEGMAQHLTKHNMQALSPAHAPSTMTIHSLASRLARKLYESYGIYTPEANAADMLWRLTKSMAGTPLLYVITKRVMSAVSAPLTIHESLAPGLQVKRSWEAKRHQYDNAPVEASLIAGMVIGLKMIYGLDGTKRRPKDAESVINEMPMLQDYLKEIERLEEGDRAGNENLFDSRHNLHVGDMSDSMADQYISFCEKALLGSTGKDDGVEKYFWLKLNKSETKSNNNDNNNNKGDGNEEEKGYNMFCDKVIEGITSGKDYKIWNGMDIEGEVPFEYGIILKRSAEVVGVSEGVLSVLIEKYDRRVVDDIRRRERPNE